MEKKKKNREPRRDFLSLLSHWSRLQSFHLTRVCLQNFKAFFLIFFLVSGAELLLLRFGNLAHRLLPPLADGEDLQAVMTRSNTEVPCASEVHRWSGAAALSE